MPDIIPPDPEEKVDPPPPLDVNIISDSQPEIRTAAYAVTGASALWIIKILYDLFFCGCL